VASSLSRCGQQIYPFVFPTGSGKPITFQLSALMAGAEEDSEKYYRCNNGVWNGH